MALALILIRKIMKTMIMRTENNTVDRNNDDHHGIMKIITMIVMIKIIVMSKMETKRKRETRRGK